MVKVEKEKFMKGHSANVYRRGIFLNVSIK